MLKLWYIALGILQLAGLVRCFRTGKGWHVLLTLCVLSAAGAFGVMLHYNGIPGAAWAYFREVAYSLCAGIVYGILGLITLLGLLLKKK